MFFTVMINHHLPAFNPLKIAGDTFGDFILWSTHYTSNIFHLQARNDAGSLLFGEHGFKIEATTFKVYK